MKKIVFILLIMMILFAGCDETQRKLTINKTNESYLSGLNRIVTVYTKDGKIVKMYKGKFEIWPWSSNGIMFDIQINDGQETKRVIVDNAVIICEEQ